MPTDGGTMKATERLFHQMKESQLVALLSPKQKEECVIAYEALSPLGIVLEIAFRTATALEGIELLLKKYPQALVLAGTVMAQDQAEKAISAGVAGNVSADFIPSLHSWRSWGCGQTTRFESRTVQMFPGCTPKRLSLSMDSQTFSCSRRGSVFCRNGSCLERAV